MKLSIPSPSLVVLIGPSGAGKSTFARTHFKPTEILSSDAFRAMVADDENDQGATGDAFELLHTVAAKRLANGRLTVIDATNVEPGARRPLIELARRFQVPPVAIVLDLPERVSLERNRQRPDRQIGPHVVRRQRGHLKQGLRGLEREGFRQVHLLSTPDEVAATTIERRPLTGDRRDPRGPFDIIGDVHGCFDELCELLEALDYRLEERSERDGRRGRAVTPPAGRTAIFVGDLVDRGPRTPDALRLAMGMVDAGTALCVPGNHDDKLLRFLKGRKVKIAHGLAESLAQLAAEPPGFREQVVRFLDGLPSHLVLDGGALVVAHAGMKEALQGGDSRAVRDFALYGETTGKTDEFGLPVRLDWAKKYRGGATVVYGHTPIPEPEWINRTINIDTGCVFGGRLTALRYPEMELVSVPAHRVYAKPARPFPPGTANGIGLAAHPAADAPRESAGVAGDPPVDARV